MRIVIHYKDGSRDAFDTSFLIYGDDGFEFDADGHSYIVFSKDIISFSISEDFYNG